ncbi:hypothetical protein T4B_8952, partial [Trichinella pseudospiralis]
LMIRHRYGDCYLHNGALEIKEQLEEQETYYVWIRRFCKSLFISNYAVFLE